MLLKLAEKLRQALASESDLEWDGGHDDLTKELVHVMLDFPQKPDGFSLDIKKPKTYKKVILVSGGMDSSIMWWLNKGNESDDVLGVFVAYGQDYSAKELQAIKQFGIKNFVVHIIDLTLASSAWEHIVPTRNFQLIALAEQYVAHEGEIWIGAVEGESSATAGDKSKLFFNLVANFIWRTKQKWVTIKTLEEKTKNDWLQAYVKDTGKSDILSTVTCFSGDDGHCGKCQACLRKAIAIVHCDLSIHGIFKENPFFTRHADEYIEKFKVCLDNEDFSHYSKARCEQDLKVLLSVKERI